MSMTDPIAHMLTKMRNAIVAKKPVVEISSSQLKARIAEIFKAEGYIKDFKVTRDKVQGVIQIQFKYDKNAQNVITNLQRVSKPSRRVYVANDDIPSVLNGMGMAILSTSKGVMTDRAARQAGVGGEVICYVW
jgi:small subunit ribosomal protein S8